MSVVRKALCMIGHHAGEWSEPGVRCEAVRVCASCGKVEQETHHAWGPFNYVSADQCDQVRRCLRCEATEIRTVHEWGPWIYRDNEFNTPQVHRCRRCHESERTRYTLR